MFSDVDPSVGALSLGPECTCVRPLAMGGFGEVFVVRRNRTLEVLKVVRSLRAEPPARTRSVVLVDETGRSSKEEQTKRANSSPSKDPDPLELQVLRRLCGGHPHVVSLRHFSLTTGDLYLFFAYEPDGDLGTLIARARRGGSGGPSTSPVQGAVGARGFREPYALECLAQLSSALCYIHERGVVHRDVKPQNIFYNSAENKLKLGDFGISKFFRKLAEQRGDGWECDENNDERAEDVVLWSALSGTFSHLPPEILLSEQRVPLSPKSDLYQLGLVVYELCTLRLPYEASNVGALTLKIAVGFYHSISASHYSHRIRYVVKRLLKRTPSKRPSAFEILRWMRRLDLLPCVVAGATTAQEDSGGKTGFLPTVTAAAADAAPARDAWSRKLSTEEAEDNFFAETVAAGGGGGEGTSSRRMSSGAEQSSCVGGAELSITSNSLEEVSPSICGLDCGTVVVVDEDRSPSLFSVLNSGEQGWLTGADRKQSDGVEAEQGEDGIIAEFSRRLGKKHDCS